MDINEQKNTRQILNSLGKNSRIAIRKARFAKLYDYDQNKFFDFCLDYGNVILGYNPKVLTRELKNSISRGYYYYAPSHAEIRAKNLIGALFSGPVHITFFTSSNALFRAVQKSGAEIKWDSPLENKKGNGLNLFGRTLRISVPQNYNYYLLSPALANGFPVYTFVSRESSALESEEIPPLYLQSIITVLSEYKKGKWEERYEELLTPFSGRVNYSGGGIFSIPDIALNEELAEKLYEKGIYVNPDQAVFYLCPETEAHQIKYLFKTLKRLGYLN
jgi:hypothetical protein